MTSVIKGDNVEMQAPIGDKSMIISTMSMNECNNTNVSDPVESDNSCVVVDSNCIKIVESVVRKIPACLSMSSTTTD